MCLHPSWDGCWFWARLACTACTVSLSLALEVVLAAQSHLGQPVTLPHIAQVRSSTNVSHCHYYCPGPMRGSTPSHPSRTSTAPGRAPRTTHLVYSAGKVGAWNEVWLGLADRKAWVPAGPEVDRNLGQRGGAGVNSSSVTQSVTPPAAKPSRAHVPQPERERLCGRGHGGPPVERQPRAHIALHAGEPGAELSRVSNRFTLSHRSHPQTGCPCRTTSAP